MLHFTLVYIAGLITTPLAVLALAFLEGFAWRWRMRQRRKQEGR